jgi:hypothetical protein
MVELGIKDWAYDFNSQEPLCSESRMDSESANYTFIENKDTKCQNKCINKYGLSYLI